MTPRAKQSPVKTEVKPVLPEMPIQVAKPPSPANRRHRIAAAVVVSILGLFGLGAWHTWPREPVKRPAAPVLEIVQQKTEAAEPPPEPEKPAEPKVKAKRSQPPVKGKAAQPATPPFPRRLLAISINQYLYANPTQYGSARRNISTWAARIGDRLNIAPQQTYVLNENVQGADGRTPTKPVIEQSVERFLDTSRKQDRIIMLFAGHAIDIEGEAFLVPLDGELSIKDSLIPLTWLYDRLQKCSAQEKWLILDICRFDPGRGFERPSAGKMSKALEDAIAKVPAGVQVWSACSAEQYSYEYRYAKLPMGDVEGSVFLNQFLIAFQKGNLGPAKPEDALPMKALAERVDAQTKQFVEAFQEDVQQPKLFGALASETVAYDPAEKPPAKFSLPQPKQAGARRADPDLVKAIFADIRMPPIRLGNKGDVPLGDRLDSLFPFSGTAMKEYADDNLTVDEIRKRSNEFPLRVAVLDAVAMMNRQSRGEVNIGSMNKKVGALIEELRGVANEELKRRMLNAQKEGPAPMTTELEIHHQALEQLAKKRAAEKSKRWAANYDYVLAQVKLRLAYVNEYNLMLGKIRKDELPPLDPALHKGWRLAVQEKMQSSKDVRELADDAKKLLEKVIEENRGTPWEILAKRDRQTAIGLSWQPTGFGDEK